MARRITGNEANTLNTADIVLLVLSGARGGNCGIAYTNGYQHGVNMGWIAKNCHQAVTPHEVGHMFGCAHNKVGRSIQIVAKSLIPEDYAKSRHSTVTHLS